MRSDLTAVPTAPLTADALDLREAVISDGLVLTRGADRVLALHTLEAGHAKPLGRFSDVRDAWAAVDALDGFSDDDLPLAA